MECAPVVHTGSITVLLIHVSVMVFSEDAGRGVAGVSVAMFVVLHTVVDQVSNRRFLSLGSVVEVSSVRVPPLESIEAFPVRVTLPLAGIDHGGCPWVARRRRSSSKPSNLPMADSLFLGTSRFERGRVIGKCRAVL